MADDDVKLLKEQLSRQKEEIEKLKSLLQDKLKLPDVFTSDNDDFPTTIPAVNQLDKESIARYSRQLILPEIGIRGQLLLRKTSVLIVGCGGLGCPAALYLTAAGIGQLGLIDHDEVEISNLHRQILHTEARINVQKSTSAAYACKQYDIVLDATDNVATRYLLNDGCVLAGKPLVSGSALRFEGQLTIYNYKGGPCYRCLFPKPPPPETVTNCSDGGVLGVVPGIIGCLQALEVIKIAAKIGRPCTQRLLLFDALDGSFKAIKLRQKKDNCEVCGSSPSITELIDYEQFCGTRATDKDKVLTILTPEERISVQDYQAIVENGEPHLLIDVRQPVELEICQLSQTINIPMNSLSKEETIKELKEKLIPQADRPKTSVFVVCRQGNDSQVAVKLLKEKLKQLPISIKDIKGGLKAWARHIDRSFPEY
ncbi:hypothetical protein LSH36_670g01043 [Paralvinella palmiformis]|uniref:Adenylyltransferase and sulfurtransferase MOCS3 homolog n=1 Tax=Paralvinella palmiformis TaxID=53620 RepID=A0AAD9J3U0_9ANNE|nr:hypothetical protein LSH36_670g01043 [Paralvinella palmiformis]